MATVSKQVDPVKVFAGYQNRLIRRELAVGSLREYRVTTDAFLQFLQERDLAMEEVRRPDVEDFFAQTGWAPSTQHARVTWLRAAWKYAKYELEALDRSPFEGLPLELKKIPVREPRIIANRELREIKDGIKKAEHWVLFHLLAYTGMRIMEIRHLKWDDVSRAEQTLNFIGKGDKERTIPLHPALQEALKSLPTYAGGSPYVLPGRGGGVVTHQGAWVRVKAMAKGHDVSPHDFRRTFATSLHENGAAEPATRQILGHPAHKDAHVAYHRLSQRYLYREILKVYADDPI